MSHNLTLKTLTKQQFSFVKTVFDKVYDKLFPKIFDKDTEEAYSNDYESFKEPQLLGAFYDGYLQAFEKKVLNAENPVLAEEELGLVFSANKITTNLNSATDELEKDKIFSRKLKALIKDHFSHLYIPEDGEYAISKNHFDALTDEKLNNGFLQDFINLIFKD